MGNLTINQLSFSYRLSKVLHGITLSFLHGEITYILGPNGAGKSTLVNCITGISSGFKGEIEIPKGSRMGALLDQPFVYPTLTVQDNIRIFLRYNKMEYSDYHNLLNQHLEVDKLLDKRFKKMSQGQRQRVLLFLAMINGPDILLLDEPFNGLDPFYTEKLIALLLRLKEDNRIILINDHIISHTMRLADQIVFLIQHEIIWTTKADVIKKGLYYSSNGKSDTRTSAIKPFADNLHKNPSNGDTGTQIQVTNLTQLYTLAVEHGKTIGI